MRVLSPTPPINAEPSRLISSFLLAGMLVCAALTFLSLVETILPGWQPPYAAVLVFISALERLYIHPHYKKLALFSREWALVIATEWVVLILLVKLSVGLSHGLAAFLAEVPRWMGYFMESFLAGDFLFTLSLVLIAWAITANYAGLLDEMSLRQALIQMDVPAYDSETRPARERLLGDFVSLGAFLVVLTALQRLNLREILTQAQSPGLIQLPVLAGGGGSTLLYFVLGLILLSQTQLMNLQVAWTLQKLPAEPGIPRRWALDGLLFFLILAAGVSLLPTSYSLGLLSALGYGFEVFAGLLFSIGQFLLAVVLFLLNLIFRFPGQEPSSRLQHPVFPQPPSTLSNPVYASPAWLEPFKGLSFWVLLVSVLVFSLIYYLRQHTELLRELQKNKGLGFLIRLWDWLKELFLGVKLALTVLLEPAKEHSKRLNAAGDRQGGDGFLNLRRLNPRQKIAFFYLAMLHRAGQTGLARPASKTPIEYAITLNQTLPDLASEIQDLTEAFVEARYSNHLILPEKANLVQNAWGRIKNNLRRKQ